MSGVNKVIIVGRLGNDPEMKTISPNSTVTRLSVATSENWVDKNGQKQERTEWHRIVVWGKLAEICGKYLAKGRQVYVEGRLQTRSWEDQGQKKYSTEIIANTVQFLGGANERAQGGAGYNQGMGGTTSNNPSDDFGFNDFGPEPSFDNNDEIPF